MTCYDVVPGELKRAAAAFDQASRQTEVHAAEFLVVAAMPDSAFGNLSESYKMVNEYHDFFGQVQKDLKALQDGLASGAARLSEGAAIYLAAEAANCPSGLPRSG